MYCPPCLMCVLTLPWYRGSRFYVWKTASHLGFKSSRFSFNVPKLLVVTQQSVRNELAAKVYTQFYCFRLLHCDCQMLPVNRCPSKCHTRAMLPVPQPLFMYTVFRKKTFFLLHWLLLDMSTVLMKIFIYCSIIFAWCNVCLCYCYYTWHACLFGLITCFLSCRNSSLFLPFLKALPHIFLFTQVGISAFD